MFSVNDLPAIKVDREAWAEAIECGRWAGEFTAKLTSIPRLAALGLGVE